MISIFEFWRCVDVLVDADFSENWKMETCFSETSASTNTSTRRQNPKTKKKHDIFLLVFARVSPVSYCLNIVQFLAARHGSYLMFLPFCCR
jgi:hypothetical protein